MRKQQPNCQPIFFFEMSWVVLIDKCSDRNPERNEKHKTKKPERWAATNDQYHSPLFTNEPSNSHQSSSSSPSRALSQKLLADTDALRADEDAFTTLISVAEVRVIAVASPGGDFKDVARMN